MNRFSKFWKLLVNEVVGQKVCVTSLVDKHALVNERPGKFFVQVHSISTNILHKSISTEASKETILWFEGISI